MTNLLQKLLGSSYPAIRGGILAAVGVAIGYAIAGDFADGVQGVEWAGMAAPILAGLGIHTQVSPAAPAPKKRRRRK